MLQAAGQYRDMKASMYRASENAAAEPEYIPWTGDNMKLLTFTWCQMYFDGHSSHVQKQTEHRTVALTGLNVRLRSFIILNLFDLLLKQPPA